MSPRRFSAAVLALTAVLATSCGGHGGVAPVAATPATVVTPTPTPTHPPVTCPLTGVAPTSKENVGRTALAVKIDNINPARPQSGVDHADVVVEELVEGGLTRLFAVFQCDAATRVGPIRSARTSDADLLALLHGSVFGYSGANPGAMPPIRKHGDAVLIPYDTYGSTYHRDHSRVAPHNVYSSTEQMLTTGRKAHGRTIAAPKPLFTYGPIDTTATPAAGVAMTWPQASASWRWGGSSWLRTQNGTADKLTDGTRVHAANVVVMSISIASTGLHDVLGNSSPLNVTVGSGKVWVLRDGKVIAGTWHRSSVRSGLRLLDPVGKTIALAPGKTWIELLPRSRAPKLS